jgi:hypothetical protein
MNKLSLEEMRKVLQEIVGNRQPYIILGRRSTKHYHQALKEITNKYLKDNKDEPK